MLKFSAQHFYLSVINLQSGRFRLEGRIREARNQGDDVGARLLSDGDRENVPTNLRQMKFHAAALGARITEMAIDDLLEELKEHPDTTVKTIVDRMVDIDKRLQHELSLVSLFAIESDHSKYFDTVNPFGEEVSDRLAVAIPDIEDAGKCIALNQGTASVFHSMRVMEAALKCLGTLLDIPYAPSWESYITQIESKITARHKTKGIQWRRDEAFYREILGNLQTIKIAWRNPTMHIVRRYSVEEAEEIYIAIRSFLKRLGPKLPKPKMTAKVPV